MPRYFFDTQDGRTIADAEGVELPDLAAAQIEAVRLAGELLADHASEFWGSRVFVIFVRDETGANRLVITITGACSPTRADVDAQTGR